MDQKERMMVVEKKRQQPYVEKSLMPNLKKKKYRGMGRWETN